MTEPSGILVTPSSPNGDTLRNIIAIMFDKECVSAEKLPIVDKILFIETPELTEMRIDGKAYTPESGYEQIMRMLNLESVEIRRKRLMNPTTDIPRLIVSAVKEAGTESIILDLTNGKKDITGSLCDMLPL